MDVSKSLSHHAVLLKDLELHYKQLIALFSYPIGTILAGETWKDVAAPRVVSFSSRGPNPITADILKVMRQQISCAWDFFLSLSINNIILI